MSENDPNFDSFGNKPTDSLIKATFFICLNATLFQSPKFTLEGLQLASVPFLLLRDHTGDCLPRMEAAPSSKQNSCNFSFSRWGQAAKSSVPGVNPAVGLISQRPA